MKFENCDLPISLSSNAVMARILLGECVGFLVMIHLILIQSELLLVYFSSVELDLSIYYAMELVTISKILQPIYWLNMD